MESIYSLFLEMLSGIRGWNQNMPVEKPNTTHIDAHYMHTHLILRTFPKQEHQGPSLSWPVVVGFVLTFFFRGSCI